MSQEGVKIDVPHDPDWAIAGRPGFAGSRGKMRDEERDMLFGPGLWRVRHVWKGRVIDRGEALGVYEDGYFDFLRNNLEVLEWLCSTASEVYDIEPSNIDSGLDYERQECSATHLQDIAVRRVLARLDRKFEGDHLVQIRGRKSEGYLLSPSELPFHEPENILQPSLAHGNWWKKGSVEDFWQSNKILQISRETDPDVLKRWAVEE